MIKVSVLSGGILPERGYDHRTGGQLQLRLDTAWGFCTEIQLMKTYVGINDSQLVVFVVVAKVTYVEEK